MAQVGELLDKNQFSCSFCLDLLKDPVTIPCGHSYCMDCIKRFWDGAGRHHHVRVYSCPQCRQTFDSRPVLGRNTLLAEMLMKIGKIGFLTTPPDQSYAGPGDVECDVCTGRKRKAVKSCLVCLVSHCDTHLKFHDELNPGKRHKLIDATGQLKNKVCSHHDKLLEVYCRTDQQCICYQCMMAEHKGHDTVCAITERTEQQTRLAVKQRECQQRTEQREKEVQELRQTADSITCSAQAAVEDTDRIYDELKHLIFPEFTPLKNAIRGMETTALSETKKRQERLEQEIVQLRRKESEMEQISHTEDHIHFLQCFQSLCTSAELGEIPSNNSPKRTPGDIGIQFSISKDEMINNFKKKIKDTLTATPGRVTSVTTTTPEGEIAVSATTPQKGIAVPATKPENGIAVTAATTGRVTKVNKASRR